METWRLLETWDREPGFNMALDEALLSNADTPPTLRFYTWKPAALSLGYFQRARDVTNLDRAEVVARRLTGGGAIHHAHELTFSIAVPDDHPLYRGDVRASYTRVHAVIARALRELGVEATERGDARLASERTTGGMCFERSTDIDLAWDGAKGVGSAQRRTGGRVLHHGSIKLDRSELDANVAAIRDHAADVTPDDLARRIARAFAAELAIELQASDAMDSELEAARERARYFTSEAFVFRR